LNINKGQTNIPVRDIECQCREDGSRDYNYDFGSGGYRIIKVGHTIVLEVLVLEYRAIIHLSVFVSVGEVVVAGARVEVVASGG